MNELDTKIVDYIQQQFAAGILSVTESEIMSTVVPAEQPELRFKPSYKYALDRLRRRQVINAVDNKDGVRHYFIGYFASPELRQSLGI